MRWVWMVAIVAACGGGSGGGDDDDTGGGDAFEVVETPVESCASAGLLDALDCAGESYEGSTGERTCYLAARACRRADLDEIEGCGGADVREECVRMARVGQAAACSGHQPGTTPTSFWPADPDSFLEESCADPNGTCWVDGLLDAGFSEEDITDEMVLERTGLGDVCR